MQRIETKIAWDKLPSHFTEQILQWAQNHETFAWLDSNAHPQKYSTFQKVLAIGVVNELKSDDKNAFIKLETFQKITQDYLFGFLGYDLKNELENLYSHNFDGLQFPDLYFFQPQKLYIFHQNHIEILYHKSVQNDLKNDLLEIQKTDWRYSLKKTSFNLQQRVSKEDYFHTLTQLKQRIKQGDTYETNFCLEFFSETVTLNPLHLFKEINKVSKPPFAVFFKHQNLFLISASPERFVRKEGLKVITQPIKGTAKRGKNTLEDEKLKSELRQNPKERSENIMIVDLVRNDLSKTASKGSVKVEELAEIYTFPSVHQMISTVTSIVNKDVSPVQILESLFPMGSMTGAPKKSTMQIIEDLESTKRGVYSGAFGYFTPHSDFDFNVVIRSVLYNNSNQYLSFSVGGAITSQSNAEQEYQECLLKAKPIIKSLNKFLNKN